MSLFRCRNHQWFILYCGRPEKDSEENTQYNYYVSKVRIRSKHCIGFLKGRWSSLCGLCTHINDERGLHYGTLWITACILLHAFAIDHESSTFTTRDRFFREGLKILRQEQQADRDNEEMAMDIDNNGDDEGELTKGKLKHEQLKGLLFAHLDNSDD